MTFIHAIEKAGINGIVAGISTIPLFGSDATIYVPMAKSSAPLYVLAFAVGGVGSLVGDLAHTFIKNEIHISEKSKDKTSLIAGIAINAGLFAGLLYCYDPQVFNDFGTLKALGVGGASEFVGSASYTYLKENLYL